MNTPPNVGDALYDENGNAVAIVESVVVHSDKDLNRGDVGKTYVEWMHPQITVTATWIAPGHSRV